MSSISKLEKNSNYLKVIWDDGEESMFNYLWLRDNCQQHTIKIQDIECLIF